MAKRDYIDLKNLVGGTITKVSTGYSDTYLQVEFEGHEYSVNIEATSYGCSNCESELDVWVRDEGSLEG